MVLRRNNGIMSKKSALNIRMGVRPHPMHPSLPPALPPPKIRHCQHRLFVWKFPFKEKKKTFKEKLSFQSMSIGWAFFTNIEDHDCVSNLIISTMTWRKNAYRQVHS